MPAHRQHPQHPRASVTERLPSRFPGQPSGPPPDVGPRGGFSEGRQYVVKQATAVEDRADPLLPAAATALSSGRAVATIDDE